MGYYFDKVVYIMIRTERPFEAVMFAPTSSPAPLTPAAVFITPLPPIDSKDCAGYIEKYQNTVKNRAFSLFSPKNNKFLPKFLSFASNSNIFSFPRPYSGKSARCAFINIGSAPGQSSVDNLRRDKA
jgi:hypothetical protein